MAIDTDKLVTIGRITAVFGIQGWVKIHSYTEPPENLLHYSDTYIKQAGVWKSVCFDKGRQHGKGLVAHIVGCDDRDSAAAYVKVDIATPTESLAALDEGEYYWHQLENLQVWNVDSQGHSCLLGLVDHLMETGSNDVLVVIGCEGSIDDRERLIPYRPEVIKTVDLAAGRLLVDWDPEF